jgi:UDP-glucose 4-epimerase
VYGNPEDFPVTEKSIEAPVNVYGKTKLEIDNYLTQNAASFGISSISFRFFNAGGGYKNSAGKWLRIKHAGATHLIPSILHSSDVKPLTIYGKDWPTHDGTPVRDFVHVSDLANALVKSLNFLDKPENTIINLGTATGSTVLEVIQAAESALNRKINFKFTDLVRDDLNASKSIAAAAGVAASVFRLLRCLGLRLSMLEGGEDAVEFSR